MSSSDISIRLCVAALGFTVECFPETFCQPFLMVISILFNLVGHNYPVSVLSEVTLFSSDIAQVQLSGPATQ